MDCNSFSNPSTGSHPCTHKVGLLYQGGMLHHMKSRKIVTSGFPLMMLHLQTIWLKLHVQSCSLWSLQSLLQKEAHYPFHRRQVAIVSPMNVLPIHIFILVACHNSFLSSPCTLSTYLFNNCILCNFSCRCTSTCLLPWDTELTMDQNNDVSKV